jgi:hypothetical protein
MRTRKLACADAPYTPGNRGLWVKVKCLHREEFVVVGWHMPAHLARQHVLSQPLIHDLAQQIVVGPGQEFDLGNKLGPHPMHAAQYQW